MQGGRKSKKCAYKYEINLKSDILVKIHVIIKQETNKAGTWYPLSLYQITFQENANKWMNL